jgi:hypothetical protein
MAGSRAVEFAYRLTGTGWSEARLSDGDSSVTITASYLGDALGELLEAIGLLLEGAEQARCSWAEEPGEFRWVFDRASTDVRLRVLAFPSDNPRQPDDSGRVIFQTTAPLRDVAGAIASGAQTLLDEHGEEEYGRRWALHPFPVGQLELIRAKLAAD